MNLDLGLQASKKEVFIPTMVLTRVASGNFPPVANSRHGYPIMTVIMMCGQKIRISLSHTLVQIVPSTTARLIFKATSLVLKNGLT